jgi:hypothetical protein
LHILYRYVMFLAWAVLLTACAAVNPNPNIGLRSVDLMLSGGNCKGALEMLNFHANRGEPWAQFRLGKVTLSGQCPGFKRWAAVNTLPTPIASTSTEHCAAYLGSLVAARIFASWSGSGRLAKLWLPAPPLFAATIFMPPVSPTRRSSGPPTAALLAGVRHHRGVVVVRLARTLGGSS